MSQVEEAWRNGDFVFVRQGLKALAEGEGGALAQYRYGRVLLEGTGGPRDPAAAMDWLEKAVTQNHAPASTLLARVLLSNKGEGNAERAANLLSSAAKRGDAEAQYYLGLLLMAGQGVAPDPKAAFDWFLAAGEAGNPAAQYELSKAYSRGVGTDKNPEEALRWLEEAASGGFPDAQYFLANALDTGGGVPMDKKAALDWFRRAAEAGQPQAQRELGTRYLVGQNGVEPNADEALRWLRAAADAGDRSAMHNLGIAYAGGELLPQDFGKSVQWFEEASYLGLGRSSLALGQLYAEGRGVEQNMEKAVGLFETAAQQGEMAGALAISQLAKSDGLGNFMAPQRAVSWVMVDLAETGDAAAEAWVRQQADAGVRIAQINLGEWYLAQEDRKPEGIALIRVAAMAGSVPAQFRLGSLHVTGDGVDLDYVAAHKWLNIAAASGHPEAAEKRGIVGDLMTPEQIARAQAEAREYFDTARSRAPQTEQTVRTPGSAPQVTQGATSGTEAD
ncbi:hypothetical protein BOO69_00675 [Sulfitobacter alexandrii]|uniref:Sel1 repeat family protein n=2 Tax=Sulfitobacter alexandrii TaxID=1917485 RepID=A0A1J0WD50_9RHOB|nr:hypothetical protein BOO69_00675 [Sulfitobacter alexandrii]